LISTWPAGRPHTPDGTAFAVHLNPRDGGGGRLVVSDTGPGLPDGTAILRRGVSGAGSTGLGLDIARRGAQQAGGRLTLSRSDRGGLDVVLELGPPSP